MPHAVIAAPKRQHQRRSASGHRVADDELAVMHGHERARRQRHRQHRIGKHLVRLALVFEQRGQILADIVRMRALKRRQPAVLHGEQHVHAGKLAEHAHVALGQLLRFKRQKHRAAHLLGNNLRAASERGKRHGQFLHRQLQQRLTVADIGVGIQQKCVGHIFSLLIRKPNV